MEKGIRYLKELAVVEVMYGISLDDNSSSQDLDDVTCVIWQRVVQNAPSLYASTQAGMN